MEARGSLRDCIRQGEKWWSLRPEWKSGIICHLGQTPLRSHTTLSLIFYLKILLYHQKFTSFQLAPSICPMMIFLWLHQGPPGHWSLCSLLIHHFSPHFAIHSIQLRLYDFLLVNIPASISNTLCFSFSISPMANLNHSIICFLYFFVPQLCITTQHTQQKNLVITLNISSPLSLIPIYNISPSSFHLVSSISLQLIYLLCVPLPSPPLPPISTSPISLSLSLSLFNEEMDNRRCKWFI